MRFRWALTWIFLSLPAFVAPRSVDAQDSMEATEASDSADDQDSAEAALAQNLYHRATLAFEAEEWAEAAELYQRAYDLQPYAELLYNLALSQERSLQDQEALSTYRAFIAATAEGAPKRDEARSRASTLETRLRANEPRPETESVQPETERVQEARSTNALPLTLVIVGGASLAAAAGALLGRLSVRSSLNDECVAGGCEAPQHSLVDRYDRLGVASWVLLGVGAAATLSGVLLWSSDDDGMQASTDGQRLIVRGTF